MRFTSGLRPSKSRSGSILVLVICLAVILMVMVSSALAVSSHIARLTNRRRAGDEAFYAASSGISRALSYIQAADQGGVGNVNFDKDFAQAYKPFGNQPQKVDVNSTNLNAPSEKVSYAVSIYRKFTSSGHKRIVVRSTGRAQSIGDPVYRRIEVELGPGTFADFAFFNTTSHSTIDGQPRMLGSGERFWGPVHSNRFLYVYGSSSDHLIFHSDVSIVRRDVLTSGSSSYVEYRKAKETGADYIELPSDLTELKAAATSGGLELPQDDPYYAVNYDANANNNVPWPTNSSFGGSNIFNYEFSFNGSNVTVTNINANRSFNYSIHPGTSNGAIVVNEGNVFVNGVVDGKVTLAALGTRKSSPTSYQSASNGNVIVNGELRYAGHPTNQKYTLNPNLSGCDDIVGLIAERNFALDADCPANTLVDAHVMLTGQATTNPDVRTWTSTPNTRVSAAQGQDGAFFIEDGNAGTSNSRVLDLSQIWSGLPTSGTGARFDSTGRDDTQNRKDGYLYLNGGVVHFMRGQTNDSYGGYTRRYSFDPRLRTNPPPFYPLHGKSVVLAWNETRHVGGTSFDW